MSIEINDIVKSFRSTRALDGVTCSFKKGHIIGLLGRNGAGKTKFPGLWQDFRKMSGEYP